ncbi:MAG: DUF2085 domain-containing protein [Candidatus Methanomethylophilaceae archaeon]|nr:DUF2085 domain-containing protein [Candidatus Methanomethylophilaceae archaeon]
MRRIMLCLAAAAGILTAMFVAAPFAAPPGSYLALDGSPCFIDHPWSVSELPYLIGDVLCHQEQDRSFMLNGSQLPVCSRDLGLAFGLMLGCLLCLSRSASMDRRWVAASCLMMCFTVVEWAVEPAFGNLMGTRFATGIVSGAGAGMLVGWFAKRSVERFVEQGRGSPQD